MLNFDNRGLLTPTTNILSSVEEFKQVFVDEILFSSTRLSNFNNYIKYSDALKKMLNGQPILQWINGSFVTQIIEPKDIDMVSFIDYEICQQLGTALEDFGAYKSVNVYGVDAYIVPVYPEKHIQHFYYKSDWAYWNDKFTKTRRDRSGNRNNKGYLEIIY